MGDDKVFIKQLHYSCRSEMLFLLLRTQWYNLISSSTLLPLKTKTLLLLYNSERLYPLFYTFCLNVDRNNVCYWHNEQEAGTLAANMGLMT